MLAHQPNKCAPWAVFGFHTIEKLPREVCIHVALWFYNTLNGHIHFFKIHIAVKHTSFENLDRRLI